MQGKNWLNLADSLVTKAGQVDSIETLKAKLDGLATDYLSAFAGKKIDQLTSVPEVKAFQDKLAKVVTSYRQLDERAIALFDRYFDPALNRVDKLADKLDELNALVSWDKLKGEIDPTLWNIVRQLTDGDPLGWALGMLPGTTIPSLPELKKRVESALSLIRDGAHAEIRDFIQLAKEQFGLDPFFNQLATISSPEGLKGLANDKIGHFVERLIGEGIDKLNGNALKKALEVVKQVVAKRDAFFVVVRQDPERGCVPEVHARSARRLPLRHRARRAGGRRHSPGECRRIAECHRAALHAGRRARRLPGDPRQLPTRSGEAPQGRAVAPHEQRHVAQVQHRGLAPPVQLRVDASGHR